MFKANRWIWLISLLVILALGVILLDFYFLSRLSKGQRRIKQVDSLLTPQQIFIQNVSRKAEKLALAYVNPNPRSIVLKQKLLEAFRPREYSDLADIFREVNSWPIANKIYPEDAGETLGQLIKALQFAEFTKVYNSNRGTQLKLVLKFKHNQPTLFKPSWYKRDTTIHGPVYSGKDRHNSEIIAFYLGAILGFRWTPIAVGRKISLSEVYKKADAELKGTMIAATDKTCVYGKCFYCTPEEQVCGTGEQHLLEGALLYLIPGTLQKHLSPWQRTYKADKVATWEKDQQYCASQKKKLPLTRLLDIIDIAIFDYLIQNGDRHRHESRDNRLVIVDNGKGFGNAFVDHLDILTPLYQCCLLRKSTWDRLKIISGGALTDILDELTKFDLLYPLLTDDHLKAMEKRLLKIFAAIELCMEKYGKDIFQ